MTAPLRILRVTYRGKNGKVARFYAKVPYSGIYSMTETLARLLSYAEIRWFRVEPATPAEINARRNDLKRWPEALKETVDRTHTNVLI